MKSSSLYLMTVLSSVALFAAGCQSPTNPDLTGKYEEAAKPEGNKYVPEAPTPTPVPTPEPTPYPTPVPEAPPVFDPVQQPPPPPAPKKNPRYTQGDDANGKFNPKVDILFVVDTSSSMKDDQVRLQKNVDKFISSFVQKQGQILDFRIGAVSVWDSRLYQNEPRQDGCVIGQLRYADGICKSDSAAPYITRDTKDLINTLGRTLKIKVEPYIEVDPKNPEDRVRRAKSGPET
jgi:hypothetical protein